MPNHTLQFQTVRHKLSSPCLESENATFGSLYGMAQTTDNCETVHEGAIFGNCSILDYNRIRDGALNI